MVGWLSGSAEREGDTGKLSLYVFHYSKIRSCCFLFCIIGLSRMKTHFRHGARLLPDSHDSPDGDLQAAHDAHTYPQAFAPRGVLIRAVMQGRSVHLDEDVGQDELHEVKYTFHNESIQ